MRRDDDAGRRGMRDTCMQNPATTFGPALAHHSLPALRITAFRNHRKNSRSRRRRFHRRTRAGCCHVPVNQSRPLNEFDEEVFAQHAGSDRRVDQFYIETAREGHLVTVGIVGFVMVLMRIHLIMSCLLSRSRKCKETWEPAVQRGT